jgi:2-polyprenyl-6-methoxyphenol hydroxylase-like FAD-dependent oxidoreductase
MASADPIRQLPVVIVGAGPAGLVTAVTLARNGIASLLVERIPGLSPLPRATAVSTRTMELLRSWGLEDEVRAGQLDITAVGAWTAETMASPDGVLMPLGHPDLEQAAAASPTRLAGVPQDHWEPVLLRHLETFGLAEVRFGPELVAPRPGHRRRHRRPAGPGHRRAADRPERLRDRRRRRPLAGAEPARHRHGRPRPPERAAHGAVRGPPG